MGYVPVCFPDDLLPTPCQNQERVGNSATENDTCDIYRAVEEPLVARKDTLVVKKDLRREHT